MKKMESVKNFEKVLKDAKKAFKKSFNDELKEFSKDLFAKYPGLESFGWTQYTPYFMDGDPCVFDIGHAEMNGKYAEADYYDDDENYFEGANEAAGEIEDFVYSLSKCASALESIFGDHALITVKRDGEIEVTEYYHD